MATLQGGNCKRHGSYRARRRHTRTLQRRRMAWRHRARHSMPPRRRTSGTAEAPARHAACQPLLPAPPGESALFCFCPGVERGTLCPCGSLAPPEAAAVLLGRDDGGVLARAAQYAALLHPRLDLLVPSVLHRVRRERGLERQGRQEVVVVVCAGWRVVGIHQAHPREAPGEPQSTADAEGTARVAGAFPKAAGQGPCTRQQGRHQGRPRAPPGPRAWPAGTQGGRGTSAATAPQLEGAGLPGGCSR